MNLQKIVYATVTAACGLTTPLLAQKIPAWQHLSSSTGQLPPPGAATQQTASLVADLDKNGAADFVIGARKAQPVLVWYRKTPTGWNRTVIEDELLPIEAGGASYDIDGDGDDDIVFGGDYQSNQLWWWENPYPTFDSTRTWTRHTIKRDGKTQHHDQLFADLKGTGRPQLVFWNQGSKTLNIADIPVNPRRVDQWPFTSIFSGNGGNVKYPEGLATADVDADGKPDLLAGNYWLKHLNGNEFRATRLAPMGGRVATGRFNPGKYPNVVIASGDGNGPLLWYECLGNPADSAAWVGHDLLGKELIHAHSLEVADVNGDGHDDILVAEMIKWVEKEPQENHPNAAIYLLLGDGKGHFKTTRIADHYGTHEAKLGDVNGDGKLDLIDKPYNWRTPRIDVWLQK